MSLRSFLQGDTPDSVTRLSFFLIVLCMLIWETYAVFSKTTVPHIEIILAFAAGILINKQYQERKANGSSIPSNQPNP